MTTSFAMRLNRIMSYIYYNFFFVFTATDSRSDRQPQPGRARTEPFIAASPGWTSPVAATVAAPDATGQCCIIREYHRYNIIGTYPGLLPECTYKVYMIICWKVALLVSNSDELHIVGAIVGEVQYNIVGILKDGRFSLSLRRLNSGWETRVAGLL